MTNSPIVNNQDIQEGQSTDRYSMDMLLGDGSVNVGKQTLQDILNDLPDDELINKLLHPEVRYEVTDHCNASCIMCPRDKHKHGREHGVMDQDKYERSVDEVSKLGANKVVLTGFGEPMLDKKLEKKIEYAKSKGLHTYVITNGSVLNQERSRAILEAGLDEMRVSFYGMGESTYNVVMKKLDYQTTMQGLMSFIEMRDQMGVRTKVQVSYLVLPENEKDMNEFREFWEPKVEAIEIWKPHNFGDGRDYRERTDDSLLKATCGRPENGPLQIQWNGEVVPCCYDYNNKIILGNAFETPVLDILNSTKYRLLRYAHRNGLFSLFPFCDQCDQLLEHADALVYTNRHNLPPEEAVKLSNTDLYDLVNAKELGEDKMNVQYRK